MQAAILALGILLLLSGCQSASTPVHAAGPVVGHADAVQAWQAQSGAPELVVGSSTVVAAHADVLDPDDVVTLATDTFGAVDRGWSVLFVEARSPDPYVMSWAIHPEPIIVVFLPAVRDAQAWVTALGIDLSVDDIAYRAMLHAGGHLLGLEACKATVQCGVMSEAASHAILFLDAARAGSIPTAAFEPVSAGAMPVQDVRRPV